MYFCPLAAVENLLITVEHFSKFVHEFKGAMILSLFQLVFNNLKASILLLSIRNLSHNRALERCSSRIFSKLL
jgi:hypothetical protein